VKSPNANKDESPTVISVHLSLGYSTNSGEMESRPLF